ncbi:molybdopterin guanine dinucleotide-containing S/N-oxide reductase [Yersinia intermedia]|uniref:molybdopterin guanine dinucleotide-containing S/N-oxide reductase n=1 Tax=Yersinia intermedia TaxID=631 RepID=UPI0005E717A9|nr:molybdopterin guanine dinucleotide-containing S/N-oxide reductase [Yersinia intermedia]MCB5312968.1 molybdopterin guanine dinucleotide-containing S/N-oxide reductase [Yersinia intermedia]MCB5326876.1 molybdopterin guanine dinucleotide-containing S/N-oxide reductase [Yersinia intermedia]UZM71840.1 molybdopterin guanine dinucleotide-containing S/N-oxide reductase [Yersinia intermedia]CNB97288.1 putative biotin sulfoxide reductas2 [Yersinia intermedia]CNI30840.1 putative biotin sulfoxide reduc
MSIIRYPQLAHWGAFTAVVEDGKLIRCEPFANDPNPSPLLESITPMVYSDKRIRKPAIRRSWLQQREKSDRTLRGREDFVEVEWDVALDLVAQENRRVRDRYGPSGLFTGSYGWSSAGRLHHARSLVRRFYFSGGGGVDQLGNYSWGSAQFFLPYVIGTFSPLTGRVTSWPSVVEHCELFIAFGGLALKNAQVSSGGSAEHSLKPWLEKLAQKGTPVINISPMRDDCPAFVNAEWIPIRPNTDVALMLALAYEIQRVDGQDPAFLATHCVGYEQLADYIRGVNDGIAKTPEWASEITGIPAPRISQLAQQLIGVRSFMTCSYSVQRAHRGEQPYWMVIALSAMLGQVGLPGGGFSFGHGSMNGVGNPRIDTPGPSMPVGKNPAGLAIPVARICDMLLQPGQPYQFQGETHTYPDIHLVHWAGGNPFHHHQQLNRLVEGWQKPDTVIVQDIWWTPAAKMADIVLPVTTSLERNDIGGSSRDRYVLAMHQAIAPQHQARNDFDIFADLAERLGYRSQFTENRDEMAWIRHIYQECGVAQQPHGVAWPDFESFWQRGHVDLPAPPKEFVFFDAFRENPQANPLQTPSGKIELFSEKIASYHYEDFAPHAEWQPPVEWLGAPQAEQWPLHLISIQPEDRLHSQLDPAPLAQGNKTAGRETLYMHPQDAAKRDITEGSQVQVSNLRGHCLAGVRITDGVTPGVVLMATGAWFDPGFGGKQHKVEQSGNPNVLTLDIGTSRLTQGPNAMSCLVEVALY